MTQSYRPIEVGVATDLRGEMTYASYLQLPTLLAVQRPVSDHHDEMLFIIQHQVTELWLKQLIHEHRSAISLISRDDLPPALKRLARIKAIQLRQMFEQLAVLEHLPPIEYVQFRDLLGKASGFTVSSVPDGRVPPRKQESGDDQGLRPRRGVASCVAGRPRGQLVRRGPALPRQTRSPGASSRARARRHAAVRGGRRGSSRCSGAEMCEELVDVEGTFQLWRFRHLKTVERIIGFKRGPGGSSGSQFLRKALELTFFPELLDVRTHIGA